MDRGFEVKIDKQNYTIKSSTVTTFKAQYEQRINSLTDLLIEEDTFDASLILSKLFPTVNADIFLSHSSQDSDYAIQIAEDLKDCGITVFIDSLVWGSVYDLLKAIDNKYCLSANGQTYDYDERNRSTAHLHMVLSTALQRMIYQTDTILFMNTEKSISLKHSVKGELKTLSPWIHMELSFSSMVRRKPRRTGVKQEGRMMDHASNESFSVVHEAPTRHLTNISDNQFQSWLRYAFLYGREALDQLYTKY